MTGQLLAQEIEDRPDAHRHEQEGQVLSSGQVRRPIVDEYRIEPESPPQAAASALGGGKGKRLAVTGALGSAFTKGWRSRRPGVSVLWSAERGATAVWSESRQWSTMLSGPTQHWLQVTERDTTEPRPTRLPRPISVGPTTVAPASTVTSGPRSTGPRRRASAATLALE